jgi:uncharacterized protein (TIGR03435 family)
VETSGPNTAREEIIIHANSLTMRNIRLRASIAWAYDVREFQILGSPDLGSPEWRGSDVQRYEVLAQTDRPVSITRLRLMLQALLADRLKLKTHFESKELAGYSLVATKGDTQLKKADDSPEQGRIGGGGTVLNGIAISMPEFAARLSGPLHTPVFDETNLDGRYNFGVNFAPYLPVDVVPTDSDMTEALIHALSDRLGLKLQRTPKRAVRMLVVESFAKLPSEN